MVVVDLRGEEFEHALRRLGRRREQRGGGGGRGEDHVRAGAHGLSGFGLGLGLNGGVVIEDYRGRYAEILNTGPGSVGFFCVWVGFLLVNS